IKVRPLPKELTVMHDGALLSVSGDKQLSVLARGIDAVKIRLARILPSEINHFVSQTAGDFKKPEFGYRFNESNIAEVFRETRRLAGQSAARPQYLAVDFGKYLAAQGDSQNHGLFLLDVDEDRDEKADAKAQAAHSEDDDEAREQEGEEGGDEEGGD